MSDPQQSGTNRKFFLVFFVLISMVIAISAYSLSIQSSNNEKLYDILDLAVDKQIRTLEGVHNREMCPLLEEQLAEKENEEKSLFQNIRITDANNRAIKVYQEKISELCYSIPVAELTDKQRLELFAEECADNDGEFYNMDSCIVICESCPNTNNKIWYSTYLYVDWEPYEQEVWEMLK